MPICYSHNDEVSRSKIPSRILRQESDSEDTVCETDVAQLQLQSFSGCICQQQNMTCMANPVITATASATQHSSGCISVCPASFVPVTVVTDTHST